MFSSLLIKLNDVFKKFKFVRNADVRIQTENRRRGCLDGMKATVELVGVRECEKRGRQLLGIWFLEDFCSFFP
jgi:hypothetical protein